MPDITVSAGGGTLPAYLAVPEGKGPWPAVVVLFEAFGANDDMRAQADRLAAHGYLALMPDLYRGKPWLRCVRGAMRQLFTRRGPVFDHIEGARAWLAGRDDCTGRVGVIGFCMGGGFALVAAARYDFQAASVNYGILPRDPEKVLAGACPIVASYGGRDRMLAGAAGKLERALTALDVPHDVKEYPGAGHGFLTDSQVPAPMSVFSKVVLGHGRGGEQAAEAWERILAFFDAHLVAPAESAGGRP